MNSDEGPPRLEAEPSFTFELYGEEEVNLRVHGQVWLEFRRSDAAKIGDVVRVRTELGSLLTARVLEVKPSARPNSAADRHLGSVPDVDFLIEHI